MIQSTKTQILTHLKRSGGATVEQLATDLGLASMTVRQHLITLERDNLVDSVEVRRHTGRPHHLYRLTSQGEERFPRRYDRLAELLLREFADIDPAELRGKGGDERINLVLERAATRLARHYAPRVEGRPLQERVAIVTEILQEESGLAEWRETPGGFEIRDLNCAYRQLLSCSDQACRWHVRFLAELTGSQVEVVPGDCGEIDCCRYVVPA